MATFEKRLKGFRKEAGMSQAALAEQIGCRPGHISHFEKGRRRPSFEALLRLCAAFGCTPNDLISSEDLPDARRVVAQSTTG